MFNVYYYYFFTWKKHFLSTVHHKDAKYNCESYIWRIVYFRCQIIMQHSAHVSEIYASSTWNLHLRKLGTRKRLKKIIRKDRNFFSCDDKNFTWYFTRASINKVPDAAVNKNGNVQNGLLQNFSWKYEMCVWIYKTYVQRWKQYLSFESYLMMS